MNKNFSIYLDLIRFLAAFLVFLDHIVSQGLYTGALSYYIPQLGRESVIVFFVLSGYVIAYSTDVKRPNVKEYIVARASRIYSVAFPILIIGFALYAASAYLEGETPLHYQLNKIELYFPFHLLFLGELWSLSESPPWLSTYWSLSYEVWYYILFGTFYFSTKYLKWPLTLLVALLMGYKLIILLPVWVSGVLLYHATKLSNTALISQKIAILGLITTFLLLLIYKYFDIDYFMRSLGNELWPVEWMRLGSADRYLADYLITLLVLANFYFAFNAKIPLPKENTIKFAASYTFTLYLLHSIIIAIWHKYIPIPETSILTLFGIIILTGISVLFVGRFTEHKKHVYSKLFRSLLNIKK